MTARLLVAGAAAAVLATGCGGGSSHLATVTTPPAPAPTPAAVLPAPSAAVLVARIKAAGLPVTHLIVYTAATDPNHEMVRQGGRYTSTVA